MSSNVAARRSTLNSATVGVFGIDEGDTLDDSNLEIINSVYEKQDEEPLSFNDKLDKLVNLMEEMHVKSRDNNAILFNMLDKFSGTVNSRIDQVRAELITKIEEASKRSEGFIAKKAVPAKHRPSAYGSQVVTPLPGFVIKTRKLLGEKAKAFINVFYHKDVEFEPGSIPKAQATDKPYFIALEAPSKTEDKEGHVSLLYNIVVSGEYFDQPNLHEDFKITSPNSIQRIIHKVNVRYGDFLDEGSYSLPRVGQGYKGDGEVPQFTIPLLLPNLPEPPASAAARPMQSIPEFPTASLPASSSSSKKDRRGSGTSSVGSGSNRSQSSTPTAGAAAANTSNDANPELAEFTGMGGITAERSDSFNSQFSEMTKDSFAPHHSRSGPLVGSGRRPSHEGSVNGSITGSQKSARRYGGFVLFIFILSVVSIKAFFVSVYCLIYYLFHCSSYYLFHSSSYYSLFLPLLLSQTHAAQECIR